MRALCCIFGTQAITKNTTGQNADVSNEIEKHPFCENRIDKVEIVVEREEWNGPYYSENQKGPGFENRRENKHSAEYGLRAKTTNEYLGLNSDIPKFGAKHQSDNCRWPYETPASQADKYRCQ